MLLRNLAQAAAAVLLSTLPSTEAATIKRATVCNGHAELCSKSYGTVAFVGAHDSYAIGTDLGSNQDQNVTQQLKDGVRLLQVQAHQQDNGVFLCHTNCVIHNGGLAVDYLKLVKSWLDGNPNEVVSILIVNSDKLPPTTWKTIYQDAGLEAISYSPPSATLTFSNWPSLGEMIDSGKRVVTFLDNQADFTQVPYIIDEFTNVWETPFDVTENSFPCTIDRHNGDTSTMMYLINHYLDTNTTILGISIPVPDRNSLTATNAASGVGSLGAEVDTCNSTFARPPNFLLVDFYEFGAGSVFQVAAKANGVAFTPQPIASPSLTNNATGTAGSGTTSTPLNNMAYSITGGVVAWTAVAGSVLLGSLTIL